MLENSDTYSQFLWKFFNIVELLAAMPNLKKIFFDSNEIEFSTPSFYYQLGRDNKLNFSLCGIINGSTAETFKLL